jgi:hypothetical protein
MFSPLECLEPAGCHGHWMDNWPGRRSLSLPCAIRDVLEPSRSLSTPHTHLHTPILALAPSPSNSDRRRQCCHADSLTPSIFRTNEHRPELREPSRTSSAPCRRRRPTRTPPSPRTAAGRRNPPPPAIFPTVSVQGEDLQVFPIIFSSFSPIYSSSSCLRSPAPPERIAGALPSPPICFSGAPPSLPSLQVNSFGIFFVLAIFPVSLGGRRPFWPPPASRPARRRRWHHAPLPGRQTRLPTRLHATPSA